MAYRFLPFPVTLNDLEGLFKCNSANIYATFCTVSTVTQHVACFLGKRLRELCFYTVSHKKIPNIFSFNSSMHTHTHTCLMALCPGLPGWAGTTKVKPVDFTEARDSEWHWHQLGRMQVCILLQTDNHASTPPLSFLQAGCPSCRTTNSVKALKASDSSMHCQILIFLAGKFRGR